MEDNQGAIALAKNPVANTSIDIRYHYIREAVEDGMIELQTVPPIK